MTAESVKISQVISGTIECSERGRDKSYVVTSKKMRWWNYEKSEFRFVIWMVWKSHFWALKSRNIGT